MAYQRNLLNVPVGTIVSAPASPGADWLPANGSNVARATYPALLAAVGELGGYDVLKARTSVFGANIVRIVRYVNGLFLAGSDGGVLATSVNGSDWVTRTHGFGTTAIRGFAYGKGLYVAVGNLGIINTSPDGITWTARTSTFLNTEVIRDVIFANNMFVAVGATGKNSYSIDGITWSAGTAAGTANLATVAYGHDVFVAGAVGGVIYTSPDAKTWTARTSNFGVNDVVGITFGNGLFVAVGATGTMTTSPDGLTWTARTSSFGTTQIRAVGYANDNADEQLRVADLTSTTGDPNLAMTGLGSFNPATARYVKIRYKIITGNPVTTDIFFLNTTYTSANAAAVVTGTYTTTIDGLWRELTIDMWTNANFKTGGNITGWRFDWASATGIRMQFDYVRLINDDGTVVFTQDWANQPYSMLATTNNGVKQVTGSSPSTGARFMAVGFAGTVATSTDGLTWTQSTALTSDNYSVAYGKNTWVAVGGPAGGSQIASGLNGTTWASVTPATNFKLPNYVSPTGLTTYIKAQ